MSELKIVFEKPEKKEEMVVANMEQGTVYKTGSGAICMAVGGEVSILLQRTTGELYVEHISFPIDAIQILGKLTGIIVERNE